MRGIVWEEPATSKQTRLDYDSVIAELKANPGKWAKVAAAQKNNNRVYTFRKFGCEATARGSYQNFDIYARWPEEAES